VPPEGRIMIATIRWRGWRWAVVASGAPVVPGETPRRPAKSCGPGAATLASIRSARAGLATVTIKAAHRGEHEGNRKTIARGRSGCPGCTCGLTRVHSCLPRRTRDCGRSRRLTFPAPSDRRGSNETAKPGQNESRERERMLTPRRQVDMNHPCGISD
jgi:hypothetical protein